ncbi:MAG TPA: iron ABC transporter substrate-binding protein [Erythrobacter sp.]|jgi:iron complex transport system substrate-binding protein|uniref:ABC transporter substrate-binding protein n=1 Tax=Qipengyuania citrea TaxID=225971 RepID=A0A6I4UER1_9SPHN|nr:ABC transporter substrate-binding protein [Qipengyuania citrea]MAG41935.1 iron ABC transporter substrate-binding protein [Erythrobacteraceae bacterium]PZO68037.1 MAG: iron ABC transporter substrate-binding protein [Pelagerythrobacter marensis]HCJ21804.1 iron ABC transporter substrate-binding protein [Erythrobacter sp.]MCD1592174.1 ABC transporter substrate-binding protein [Qipengyuania citrea]MDP7324609.1 ABC transporter substrate-binding protein [Qipengyuania citrea]|tara:strand:+ start:47 stop:877 length:831 start_codon:yes stop_codon:yes gene_type:complete
MVRTILAALVCLLLCACSQVAERGADAPRRIVSLDYCADQYVLKFADREDILALSPDARKRFSYMRAEAAGIPTVRPRAADVLALQPDMVVRTYGGGHDIADFMQEPGVPVVQIGFPQSITEVRGEVLRVGTELGKPDEAVALVAEMERRLKVLADRPGPPREVLYMTPAGVTAGEGTLVHELFVAAGLRNFQDRPGWNPLPLERLAYERPDLIAAAFFESKTNHVDNWSAARHPVARAQLRELPVVALEGSWTSCGGWFLLDAVEALATAGENTR